MPIMCMPIMHMPIMRMPIMRMPLLSPALCCAAGCAFQTANNTRSWLSCFGCAVMDPWRHQRDNVQLMFPPYAPSAALSMYAPMIRAWAEFFPVSSMRFINYQALLEQPMQMANHMLRYLGALVAGGLPRAEECGCCGWVLCCLPL
jgi:hypothetical protein